MPPTAQTEEQSSVNTVQTVPQDFTATLVMPPEPARRFNLGERTTLNMRDGKLMWADGDSISKSRFNELTSHGAKIETNYPILVNSCLGIDNDPNIYATGQTGGGGEST